MNPIEAVDWLKANASHEIQMEYGELLVTPCRLHSYCAQTALRPEIRKSEGFYVAWNVLNTFRRRHGLEPYPMEAQETPAQSLPGEQGEAVGRPPSPNLARKK